MSKIGGRERRSPLPTAWVLSRPGGAGDLLGFGSRPQPNLPNTHPTPLAGPTALEPLARQIGEALNQQGGLTEMRRVFALLGGRRGSRTLEMHWNGIGEWRG